MSSQSGDGTSVVSPVEPSEALLVRAVEGPAVAPSALPPLPDVVGDDAGPPAADIAELVAQQIPGLLARPVPGPARRRTLRAGCYLLRYTPLPPATALFPLHYDGTLRVERAGANTIASGDLYLHRARVRPPFGHPHAASLTEPNPAAGIPIFPRTRYRYYVRVTQIVPRAAGTHFTLGFELHRFDHASRSWSLEDSFTADMHWTAAPSGFPSDYLKGDVRSSSGAMVGHLTMGWVSERLRRAVVEIDRVAASETTLGNSAGLDWHEIFEQVGWDVTVDESDANLSEPSGQSWSDAEMHTELLARRDSADLDSEWRYWLICVRRLDSTDRGIMFDAFGGDSNNIPREGAGISSHWQIPNSDPWGLVRGMRFGTATDPYFRTAVHEIGHAMGLYHNIVDNGFMNTTPEIAASAVPPQQFPQNIQWSHAPDDQKRLRHMPDMWVRPGGVAFGAAYSTAPISPGDVVEDAEGLELAVRALLAAVPIGAPVRVDYSLDNTSDEALLVPASLSMKSGSVKGRVIDPSGAVRTFRSILRCIEEEPLSELDPGESVAHSVTLLRGAEGALFPAPGAYRIVVEVEWNVGGVPVATAGETSVMVTAAIDTEHAEAALRLLSTPDALLTLAIGGDHLEKGIEAVQAGLENEVLRPHYAFIEAKRLGRPFYDRPADIDAAAALIDESTVLSQAELKRAAELVRDAEKADDGQKPEALVKILQEKVREVGADAETTELVSKL
jgi:hypothetical protein